VSDVIPFSAKASQGRADPDDEHCYLGVCDGSGIILPDDTDARPTACGCRARRIAARQVKSLAHVIPEKFRGVAFDRHPIRDMGDGIRRPLRAYITNIDKRLDEGQGIWFCGDRATGKTSAAMLICKEALARNRTVAIYSLPALLAEIRTTYEKDVAMRYDQLMRRLKAVDLLSIDDMAVARTNDWMLEQLYTVVNTRYEDKRAIMCTADVEKWTDLGAHVGERTFSRLVEMSGIPVFMYGEDQRFKKAHAERAGELGLEPPT